MGYQRRSNTSQETGLGTGKDKKISQEGQEERTTKKKDR